MKKTYIDILHTLDRSPITLLRIDKILSMGYDLFVRMRGIRLFENSKSSTRCGGGKDKLH